jgi:Na+-driven multidrug efflux pump
MLRKEGPPEGEPKERGVPTVGQAAGIMTAIGLPIICQLLLGYFQALVNFIFITAYDDPITLGGLGLGMYFYACFYMTLMIGMNTAITTFGSQLKGMGRMQEIGIYLNAGRCISFCLGIPIMLCLYYSENILLAIGQDAKLSYQAGRFLLGITPSVIIFGMANLHEQTLIS